MTQPQVIPLTEQVPSLQNAQRQPLSPKVVTRKIPKTPSKTTRFKRKQEELKGFGHEQ